MDGVHELDLDLSSLQMLTGMSWIYNSELIAPGVVADEGRVALQYKEDYLTNLDGLVGG